MLIKATALMGIGVFASDGEVGTVKDVLFDDERWGVRYLVVETGSWLASRQVLLSPFSVLRDDGIEGGLQVTLTREQVRSSPHADTDKPVSRLYETAHALHYGYPTYWSGPLLWGGGVYPDLLPVGPSDAEPGTPRYEREQAAQGEIEQAAQSHLRSTRVMLGYALETSDGAGGTVDDLLIDRRSWAVERIAVDVRKWWPGGEATVEPKDVADIDWGLRCLRLHRSREELRGREAAAGTPWLP
jgi:hypothetical protein